MTYRRGWLTRDMSGSVESLHALDPLEFSSGHARELWRMLPTAPALVLGSSQAGDTLDQATIDAAGLSVTRRRSGGGAVLVDDSMLWVDFVIRPGDDLWDDDVGRAFVWVGEVWSAVLSRIGVGEVEVHRGALEKNEWNRRICFASVGPGEVLAGGKKVVGVSQRRTRAGARFQCSVLLATSELENSQLGVADVLALTAEQRAEAKSHLSAVSGAIEVGADQLFDALRDELLA